MKSMILVLSVFLSATAMAQGPDAAKQNPPGASPQREESGFIDMTGQWAFHVAFYQASSFSCGLALIQVHGKFGYIDITGKIVVEPQFDRAEGFSDDLALIKVGPKWGFIDKTGNAVIPPQFDDADGFHEGLASAFVGRKRGFIDKQGHFVIPAIYDGALAFSQGLATVCTKSLMTGTLPEIDNPQLLHILEKDVFDVEKTDCVDVSVGRQ